MGLTPISTGTDTLSSPGPVARSRVRMGSLATRLALATLGFCLLFTLLTTALRTWSAWEQHRAAMAAELAQIQQVFQGTLAKAIWEMDREALQSHVQSAAKVASVGRVALTVHQPGRAPELLELRRPGWLPTAGAPAVHSELKYEPYAGASEAVGGLTLEGDARVLRSRLQDELVSILVNQVIQSLLLAGLIMWIFNRAVTVHVQQVARHLDSISPDTLDQPLVLDRRARSDELQLLVGGVNHLQGSLSDYLARQRRDERELAAHRDRLAELVRERTVALETANAQLEQLSHSDPLTGLPNRRRFDEVKEVEFRRALRGEQRLSLLLCDVDFFKRYNDHHGHAAGDACLTAVGQVLQACFGRAGELAARIGGEEFAVLLPGLDLAQAQAAAQRLHVAVRGRALPHASSDAGDWITLSIGLAQFDPATMTRFDALFQQADQALYRAKSGGRNRTAT